MFSNGFTTASGRSPTKGNRLRAAVTREDAVCLSLLRYRLQVDGGIVERRGQQPRLFVARSASVPTKN